MSGEGTKLFVGNLPSDSSEEELRELFENYGKLGDVHVMSSTRSRHGHACAFVVFNSAAEADLAVNALNGVHHMGHGDKGPQTPISVSYARSDDVKNKKTQGKGGGGAAAAAHPAAYSAEMMSQAYSQAYTQYYAAQAAMMPYMMAQYGAHGAMAPAALQAAYAQAGYGMPAATAAQLYGYPAMYAHSEAGHEYDMSSVMLPSLLAQTAMQQEPEASASHEDTKLFVGGLPPLVTEAEIRMVFGHAGTVKEVHIMQGRSQSGQACAFVVYPDVYSAQLAIRTLNKTPWHAAPDQPPIIVRPADKAQAGGKKTKGKKNQKD